MASGERHLLDDDYRRFIEFFWRVNSLIIAAERQAGDQKLYISAVIELRSAFTHLMRVHSVQVGLYSPSEIKADTGFDATEYCRENLSKAYGHLYRAGYDAYDALAIWLDIEIEEIIQSVSQATIYAVVPDAADAVFAKRAHARDIMEKVKASKDVESPEAEKQSFDALEEGNTLLGDARDLLRTHMAHMVVYETDQSRRRRRGWVYGGIIGALVSYPVFELIRLIVNFLGKHGR